MTGPSGSHCHLQNPLYPHSLLECSFPFFLLQSSLVVTFQDLKIRFLPHSFSVVPLLSQFLIVLMLKISQVLIWNPYILFGDMSISVFYQLLLNLENSLHILDSSPWLDIWLVSFFSVCSLSLHHLNLNEVQLLIFKWEDYFFRDILPQSSRDPSTHYWLSCSVLVFISQILLGLWKLVLTQQGLCVIHQDLFLCSL